MISTIAKYTFTEVIRNRLLWSLLIIIGIVFALVLFAGNLAITERAALQVTMMASIMRIGSVLFVALIVVTSMLREQQDKQLELVLSLPLKRSSYFTGKWIGFASVVVLIGFFVSLPLFLFSDATVVVFWCLSMIFELLIVMTASLLFQFTFNQVPAAMLCVIGFYTLARSLTAIQLIAHNPIIPSQELSQTVMVKLIDGLSVLLPDLNAFTRGEWLIGSDQSIDFGLVMVQSLIYIVLLSCASMIDLYRRKIG